MSSCFTFFSRLTHSVLNSRMVSSELLHAKVKKITRLL
jgi:hypothetical protein